MADAVPFGLYVHWPFCQAKCPYCNFNSHVSAQTDQDEWARALEMEIARISKQIGPRKLDTIFFGGGTPSLMEGRTVARVIDAAQRCWNFSNDIEISLEANPTSAESRRFHEFRAAGVNRVSVGVQALDDSDLRALGRLHSAKEALQAFEMAQETFQRASFDLIYGRQNQTLPAWERELSQALSYGADHMSLYQLTIEPDTAFGHRFEKGRLPGLPSDDLGADMFELTQELTTATGLPAYEVSNHARPGHECRHNLIYWKSGEWAGIGPGAHGRLVKEEQRIATASESVPARWLENVLGGQSPDTEEPRSSAENYEERLMMGLRLNEGIPVPHSASMIDNKVNFINGLTDNLLVEYSGETIRLTPSGRPLLNAVLRELLA